MKASNFFRSPAWLVAAIGFFMALPWRVLAADSCSDSKLTIVPCCARISGSYGSPPPVPQLSCFLEMMGNIARLIMGVTGSFALLMFVYGGFMIVISAGESARVEKGKTILKNAVIGILIIMTSGVVLQYGLSRLTLNNKTKLVGQPCLNNSQTIDQTDKKWELNGSKIFVITPDGSIKCEKPPKK